MAPCSREGIVPLDALGDADPRCLAAMIVGAVVWAFAAHSNNHHDSANGRRGVLISALAALAIGASAAVVNFFAEAGDKVR